MYRKQRKGILRKRTPYFNKFRTINYGIPLCLLMLGFTGLLMLFSISGGEFNQIVMNHFFRLIVGFIVFIFFSFISFRILRVISFPMYFIILAMLIWLYIFEASTVSRWINLGGTSFQPSEFLKFILILTLASYYSFFGERKSRQLRYNVFPIMLILIPSFLILNQPDLGTAVLLILAGFATVFFSGLYLKWVALGSSVVFMTIPLIITSLKPYQMKRLEVFLDPDKDPFGSGYHIIQSKIAIGSGGLTGKGFMSGTQSQLNFLPEKHNDFMLAVLLEETGLIGGVFIFSIFFYFIIISMHTSIVARSRFSSVACGSISVLIFLYFFINCAMITGLIPIVGVPIPMLSYGGSAIISLCAAMGFVLNARRQRDIKIESILDA
ncbi:MAG: rod shape-determining protein RodA [Rhodobiaceae bacterium]|nr:rod shape-determining protein RodA [Rhodobiaceae bacterium]